MMPVFLGSTVVIPFLLASLFWQSFAFIKGTLLGTPNREPQEYSRYIIGIYLPGSLYSIIFLVYSWGSLFGVPSRLPLFMGFSNYLGARLAWPTAYLNLQPFLMSSGSGHESPEAISCS